MCGIAGLRFFKPFGEEIAPRLSLMLDSLKHRGPDGRGHFQNKEILLGHARLSIVDLETGAQPLANEDGAIQVVFNGEIYNHLELRSRLISNGHRFRTRSDTEVLVHLWEELGPDMLQELSGDFAFALWDQPRRSLFLARDRLGVKPLFYAQTPELFCFASTLPAVLAGSPPDGELDPVGLLSFFTFGAIQAPNTIFRDLRKLEPGQSCLVLNDGRIKLTRYWDARGPLLAPRLQPPPVSSLQSLLRDCVRDQLMADVPVGAFLSGGVDSGAVAALAGSSLGGAFDAFTVAYEDPAFDESPQAAQVAAHVGVRHHPMGFSPNLLADFDPLVRMAGEPFSVGSAYPLYCLSRLAATRVKVVLSGDGADELFLGYGARYRALSAIRRLHQFAGGRGARLLERLLYPSGAVKLTYSAGRFLRRMRRLAHVASRNSALWHPLLAANTEERAPLESLIMPLSDRGLLEELPYVRAFRSIASRGDWMTPFIYADIATILPAEMFTKLDVTTMAHSIEGRVPLCDQRIAEFALRLPRVVNYSGGSGKTFFREAAAPLLPRNILAARKKGFQLPLNDWLRGPLRERLHDTLFSRAARESGLYDLSRVRAAYDRHQSRHANLGSTLWALLIFETWRSWIKTATPTATAASSRFAPVLPIDGHYVQSG